MPKDVPIQHYHSTSDTAAPLLMPAGEIAVAVGSSKTRLWVGDGSANRLLLSTDPADGPLLNQTSFGGPFLPIAGGTLTGSLAVTGALNVIGNGSLHVLNGQVTSYGTDAMLRFENRSTATQLWGWYSTANNAYLWSSTNGDRLSVTPVGGVSVPMSLDVGTADVNASSSLVDGGLFAYRAADNYPGYLSFRRARGTKAAPTAIIQNDWLSEINSFGYRPNGLAGGSLVVSRANQNWTNTANGTAIDFRVIPNGAAGWLPGQAATNTVTPLIVHGGGLDVSGAVSVLDITQNANGSILDGGLFLNRAAPAGGYGGYVSLRRSRGSGAVPTAVMSGDTLGEVNCFGYRPNGVAGSAAVFFSARENWTNAANGTIVDFRVTPNGLPGAPPGLAMPNAASACIIGGERQMLVPQWPVASADGAGVGGSYITMHGGGQWNVGVQNGGTFGISPLPSWNGIWLVPQPGNVINFIVEGSIYASGTINPSDRRLKDDLQPYSSGLETIRKLQPISWRWNGLGKSVKGKGCVGLLADEAEVQFPEAVSRGPVHPHEPDPGEVESPYKVIDYQPILMAMINAINELDQKLTALSHPSSGNGSARRGGKVR